MKHFLKNLVAVKFSGISFHEERIYSQICVSPGFSACLLVCFIVVSWVYVLFICRLKRHTYNADIHWLQQRSNSKLNNDQVHLFFLEAFYYVFSHMTMKTVLLQNFAVAPGYHSLICDPAQNGFIIQPLFFLFCPYYSSYRKLFVLW
jgi:hypothetical protein